MSSSEATNDTSRRDFLKAGAATAAAAALAFPSGVRAQGSDMIRIGLIGCGGRGTGAAVNALNNSDPGLKLVALGDAFQDRASGALKQITKEHAKKVDVGDRVFVGLDAYKQVLANCDLVILATPPGFRPLHIEAAVAAGKNIFTEKPCGVDGPGIRKVLAAYKVAQEKKLNIVAGTQRRHQSSYLDSMQRIHGGDIGELVGGRCYWNQGGLWNRSKDQGMSDLEWQIRNWLYFVWLSGDHICEQHVHNLDVINWAFKTHPVKCVGLGGRQVRTGPEYGHIFDHFAIDYEYPNGVHVGSYCRQQDGTKSDVSEALIGTKGTWTSHGPVIKGEKPWSFPRGQDNQPYDQEHVDLVKAIRDGKPLNELENVAFSTLTAIMGRMAAYTGQEVTWEAALNSQDNTMPANLSFESKLPVPPVAMPGKTKLL